jgi:hypothetical protein
MDWDEERRKKGIDEGVNLRGTLGDGLLTTCAAVSSVLELDMLCASDA